jgi:hypothetical protein
MRGCSACSYCLKEVMNCSVDERWVVKVGELEVTVRVAVVVYIDRRSRSSTQ